MIDTTPDTPQVLLKHHLTKLRLPTFQSEYDKLARQCAAESKDHVQYLLRLCELELIERERRMIERRIKAAKFPATKSLDSFGFKTIPSLNKVLTMELAHCEFVGRRQNVIALGPSGTGKTHVAHGLGLAACQKGLTVRFTTAAALVHEIIEATDERRLQRHQTDQFCAGIDMILTFGDLTNGYGYANVTIGLHPEWMQSPEYPNCHIC
jgi:DNA replication protein DnaC